MENKKESLIEENSNQTGERSDSFIRRTTFIPTPESENDQDIKLLKEMGVSVFEYIRSNDEIDKLSLWQKLLLPINTIFSHKYSFSFISC